ncbi:MAG: hypothetical protein KA449_00635, partial [Pelolinea sp.]|nr:hypothetical protein [Pelolinea sp.]
MIIQIYAFTDPRQAVAAVEMGVDNIGFIAGKYDIVYGELSFDEAKEIAKALPPEGTSVALTMSTDLDEILRMAEYVEPDIVHISSEIDKVDMEMMHTLRERMAPQIMLMKAIPVEDAKSIEKA